MERVCVPDNNKFTKEMGIMICNNCGAQIPDGVRFCPNCGAAMIGNAGGTAGQTEDAFNRMANDARNAFAQAENSLSNEFVDMKNTFQNTPSILLKTDRSLLLYILLSLVTCGIYSFYFLYRLAQDVNVACDGDGEETPGLVALILLSLVTCGIYGWYWYYKLGNRLANNAPRFGMTFQENGTTVLLWDLFGMLLCGVGPLIGLYIIIKNTNAICYAYNRTHGLNGGAY